MIITIIGLLILCIFKFDIHFKRNWIENGYSTYIVWRTLNRDIYSGEYYEIYRSKKLF